VVEQRFHVKHGCLLVSGKGYLDYSTRSLLLLLSLQGKKILALYDGDPHGLEILMSLQLGSQVIGKENTFTVTKTLPRRLPLGEPSHKRTLVG
jgi:DNA topoisomerase VI subunit A